MEPNLPSSETFSEGGPLPASAPMATPVNTEDVVMLDALAMPDEQERMEPPAVGDRVSYQVEGVVARIEGGNAVVTKQSVNGQPIEPDADNMGGPSDGDADNIDKLTADAATMPQE